MKFSCPSCQAKYQIADEKVSGRTVKMKCRKCGAIIPIHEDGTTGEIDSPHFASVPLVSSPPVAPSSLAPRPPTASRAPLVSSAPVAPGARPLGKPAVKPAGLRPLQGSGQAVARVAKPQAEIEIRTPVPDAPAPTYFETAAAAVAGPPSMRRIVSKVPTAVPEWHAGLDGKAVGPLTREELRDYVKRGEVDRDTLVWREGMSGWAAISEVPDVSDLLVVIPAHAPAPYIDQDSSTLPLAAVAQASPLEKVSGWGALGEDVARDPVAPLEEKKPGGESSAVAAIDVPLHAPIPDVVSSQAAGVVSSTVPLRDTSRDSIWERARTKPTSRWAILFAVLAAIGFGVVMGFVLFGGQKTKIIKQTIEVPASTQAVLDVPAPPKEDDPSAEEKPDDEGSEPGKSAGSTSTTGKGTTGTAPVASGSSASTSAPLKGLSGLEGLGSSSPVGGPGTTGSTSGGQPLDSSQVQSTVARYQNAVKRGCWEPALGTRAKDAPSSARVTVSITVAASGSVQSVTSTGDPKGYTGLASCIERRVATWSFPKSSGSTTVKVPFVFAAQ